MTESLDPIHRGRCLRVVRHIRGWNQTELGVRSGTSRRAVHELECGKVKRSRFEARIMEALGIPLDALAAQWVACARKAMAAEVGFTRLAPPNAEAALAASARLAPPDAETAPPDAAAAPPPLALPAPDALTPAPPPAAAPDESAIRERLDADYEFFAAERLVIRAKSGALAPLVFNRAQRHIHGELEAQKAATGKVRALILKGRQQGCSTYVGGRFYHRVTRQGGLRVFILTHEEQATRNLFEMVERFHDHCADRPSTGVANSSELYFDALDSGYKVGTAGTKGVGRSATVQLFHGSEVAFWPYAQSHAAGVLQAVPDQGGTEVILESTAHGVGNLFHKMWRDAEAGLGEYVAIFVPRYWQEEYRKQVADEFMLTEEEHAYAALYGLDAEQMAWRRGKIAELNDPDLFRQEYPATAAEAFQMSGHDSFIPPALIARARKAQVEASGPLIVGYDPAYTGADRHAVAWRRGRRLIKVETRLKLDTVQAAGWIKSVIDADRPAKVFIDIGNAGAGVFDQLSHMGPPYSTTVEAVNFGSSPVEPAPRDEHGKPYGGPLNRRAEMWLKSKLWLEGDVPVQIPDSDSLQADACGPGYRYDELTRLVLEKKEDMRRRGAKSPDEWDAVALTFARPVKPSNFNRVLIYPPSGLGNGV